MSWGFANDYVYGCVSTLHLWRGGVGRGERVLALSQDPAWPGSCLNHTSSPPHPCSPLGCSPFVGTATGTAEKRAERPSGHVPGLAPSGEAGWLAVGRETILLTPAPADPSSLGLGLRACSFISCHLLPHSFFFFF